MITKQRLWSVDEYHQIADAGILHPEERVELIEGQIIPMAAKNPPHSAITKRTADYFRELLAGLADIRVQEPVRLSDRSEPEPDIAIVKTDQRDYVERHPRPEDVFLLVEVADATLAFDRKNKAAIYAKAKIAEYWVIDVKGEQIIVFCNPLMNQYQQETTWTKKSVLTITAFPDIPILVKRFFP